MALVEICRAAALRLPQEALQVGQEAQVIMDRRCDRAHVGQGVEAMTICDLLKTCNGGECIAREDWVEGMWPLAVPSISICAIIDTMDNRPAQFSVTMLTADDWEIVTEDQGGTYLI